MALARRGWRPSAVTQLTTLVSWLSRAHASEGSEPARLLAPVLGDELGGDAEQPRPYAAPRGVEAAPSAQGDDEGVSGDVVGHVPAQPSGDVAVGRGSAGRTGRRSPRPAVPCRRTRPSPRF
jgi:hypothetical protein